MLPNTLKLILLHLDFRIILNIHNFLILHMSLYIQFFLLNRFFSLCQCPLCCLCLVTLLIYHFLSLFYVQYFFKRFHSLVYLVFSLLIFLFLQINLLRLILTLLHIKFTISFLHILYLQIKSFRKCLYTMSNIQFKHFFI